MSRLCNDTQENWVSTPPLYPSETPSLRWSILGSVVWGRCPISKEMFVTWRWLRDHPHLLIDMTNAFPMICCVFYHLKISWWSTLLGESAWGTETGSRYCLFPFANELIVVASQAVYLLSFPVTGGVRRCGVVSWCFFPWGCSTTTWHTSSCVIDYCNTYDLLEWTSLSFSWVVIKLDNWWSTFRNGHSRLTYGGKHVVSKEASGDFHKVNSL